MTELRKGARVSGERREALAGELAQQYRNGASIRQLAEQTGRSYGFIHRMLIESDVPLRGRGGNQRVTSKANPT
jgi:Helix-turn-helix domain